MAFTIVFNPWLARWQVKILKWSLLWVPVKGKDFESYSEAREWADKIGLTEAYDEQTHYGVLQSPYANRR